MHTRKPTANKASRHIHHSGWHATPGIKPGTRTAVVLEQLASTKGWTLNLGTVWGLVSWSDKKSPRTQLREFVRELTKRQFITPALQAAWIPNKASGVHCTPLGAADWAHEMTLTPLGRDVVREHLPHVAIAPQSGPAKTPPPKTPLPPTAAEPERLAAIPSLRRLPDMCGAQAPAMRGPYIRPGALDFAQCLSVRGTKRVATPHTL